MTILWCGGEDIDFPYQSSFSVWTTPGYGFRSDYSRCSLSCSYQAAATNPCILGSNLSSSVSSFWLHCYYNNYQTGGANWPVAGLRNKSNEAAIAFGLKAVGQISIVKISTTGTQTEVCYETGTSIPYNTNHRIDMYIAGFGTSNGTVKVWVDDVLVIDETSQDFTVTGGETELDRFVGYGSSTGGARNFFSEIIIADEDTRLMSLKTLAPNAAGDTNDWTGAYTDIDEVTKSDADVIYTDTNGDDFQANLTGMPSGTFKIKGVKVVVRAADEGASCGLKVGVKTNSAVHLTDAHTLDSVWAQLEKLYQTNPETAAAFTSGEIEALQLAIRRDSTTTTTSTTSTTTTTA